MTRLRVLRVIARMNVGGPALQVVGLTQRLDPARFDQRLLVGSVGPDEADYLALRAPDLAVERVVGLGRSPDPTGDLRALARLVREVRSFRPHIVHTHTAKAGVLGRLAAHSARTPIVVHTFHGHLLHGYFSPAVTKGVVIVERTLAHLTTHLVAVGAQVRDDLLAAGVGKPSQYTVVPPGVTLPVVPARAEARARLGLPATTPVVAFVARLTPVKRPDRFAEVARLIAVRHPDVVFAVVGEGDRLDNLARAVAPLGDRVRMLGWRSDVETVYAAADLALLTSDNEGMPVSLIEAATVGRAAVTTDVGSAREVVIDGVTGLVTALDAGALADAVSALVVDRQRCNRMGDAAKQHAATSFSQQRLIDDIEALYERLAAERGLRP